MLSARLLSRIEKNWEKIAISVLEQSRRDVHIRHYSRLDEAENRSRCLDVIHNLNSWLSGTLTEPRLRERYRRLGAQRLEDGFPLEEVVYKLQTIEWQIVQYVQDENPPETPLDLYSELEVLRALHRFFGIAVHSVVSGYERGRQGGEVPAAALAFSGRTP